MHVADRLIEAIERFRAPVCVGIDPVVERLPGALRPADASPAACARAIALFSRAVVAAVAEHVPCVKVQSACFERYRAAGVDALFEVIDDARARGLQVILDAKRGDIGVSAGHYAAAVFGTGAGSRPDWVTVNGYFGADGVEPFCASGGGAFVLVRTSNPGGDALQSLVLEDGLTVADGMGRVVAQIGESTVGERGYSAVGAVVGATRPEAARRLRDIMPRQIFLIPGFGAQGGGLADVLPCFREGGAGAIVTASRSVIFAYEGAAGPWDKAVGRAAAALAEEIGQATGLR